MTSRDTRPDTATFRVTVDVTLDAWADPWPDIAALVHEVSERVDSASAHDAFDAYVADGERAFDGGASNAHVAFIVERTVPVDLSPGRTGPTDDPRGDSHTVGVRELARRDRAARADDDGVDA